MNIRTLLFLARKDLLKDIRVLILVLLAVGSGALAIIPLNGLLGGFTKNLTDTTINVSVGHVVVTPEKNEPYIKGVNQRLLEINSLSGIAGVSPRLMERAIVKNKDRTDALLLRGVEPEVETQTTTIAQKIQEGSFIDSTDKGAIVIGRSLATELDYKVGDPIDIVFSNGTKDRFKIKGIYYTSLRDLDTGGFVNLKELQSISGLRNRASEIAIRLNDANRSESFKRRLSRSGLVVETWQDRMAFIGQAQRNLNIIQNMMMVLSIIAAGIATTVLMYTNVQHKTRSIGILKAIGMDNREVLALFIFEGVVIGIAGAIVGDILGTAIDFYLSGHPIQATVGVTEGAASTVNLVATFSSSFLVMPTLSAIVITILASVYPAWQASRINIIEAIWRG